MTHPRDSIALTSDSLVLRFLSESGIPISDNNKVRLLKSGREKFIDLFSAIRDAKHHIHLEYFNFRSDSIGKALFTLLDKKVREGVKVRVIYDDFGNVSNDRPLRKRHLRQLKSRHFEVVVFDPIVFPWVNHALHRDHRKIVVIDDKVVYTGGMNVADYYIHGRPEFGKWRDMHMRLEGDCVPLYRRIFCEMWERCTGDKIDSLEYQTDSLAFQTDFRGLKETACADSSGVLLGVANREPKRSPAIIRRSYIDAIDNAQKRIQIVNPYFTLVPSVKKALYLSLIHI